MKFKVRKTLASNVKEQLNVRIHKYCFCDLPMIISTDNVQFPKEIQYSFHVRGYGSQLFHLNLINFYCVLMNLHRL